MRIEETGYRVLIGGKLGRHPRLATEMLALAGANEAADALRRCVRVKRYWIWAAGQAWMYYCLPGESVPPGKLTDWI